MHSRQASATVVSTFTGVLHIRASCWRLGGGVGARLLVFSGTDFKYLSPLFATVTYLTRLFSPIRYYNHITMHHARLPSVNCHRASHSPRAPWPFPLLLGHLHTPHSHPECECRRGGLGSVMSVVLSVVLFFCSLLCSPFSPSPWWSGEGASCAPPPRRSLTHRAPSISRHHTRHVLHSFPLRQNILAVEDMF